ncbi:MAG: flagellar hook-associated protein FlgL [Lachnospiraceae bacterium]|nr:flagellar hook-associated protein FlgL [Lachnospiraceae bacterium]
MRITNKIIQNNAITNINGNKVLEDNLNTQLSTGKKITRPSDDPVIAIRALRLRTNLSEVQQFYKKNVPDAKSWLSITEGAIDTAIDVITDMYSNCTSGSAGFKTAEDRQKILENMKGLRDEIYAIGNAESAGRYVFTGYRTGLPLAFEKTTKQEFTITEQLGSDSVKDITYIDSKDLGEITASNAITNTTTENDVTTNTVHRIRLSYNDCEAGTAPVIQYYDSTGALQTVTANVISVHDTTQDPYLSMSGVGGNAATFIPETGELILSDGLYADLQNVKDLPDTTDADGNEINEGEIRITYKKENWNKNDLRPEHYFYCETPADNAEGKLVYNEKYLTAEKDDDTRQLISYDVGFGQSIRVNTLANEVFTHDIGRDLEEMISNVEAVIAMEDVASTLKQLIEDETDEDVQKQLQLRLDAVNKSLTYLTNKMQRDFESGITRTQGYLDRANTAMTTVGNRSARVELVENRLSSQETSFKTLSSENEDADITEVAVQLSSVELSYQAALMATGKIAQTSLLNYL